MANLLVAYALWWFCFGPFGPALHLFYLGRDDQQLLWATTGGGFILGWLRDAWRIPAYVALANSGTPGSGAAEAELHAIKIKHQPYPSVWFQPARFVASYAVAGLYGLVASSVVDLGGASAAAAAEGQDEAAGVPVFAAVGYAALRAVGVAFAVWLVGNVGLHTGKFRAALKGAALGVVWDMARGGNGNMAFLGAFAMFSRTRAWRGVPDEYLAHTAGGGSMQWFHRRGAAAAAAGAGGAGRVGCCRRALTAVGAWCCFVALVASGVYHHGSMTDKHGNVHRVRDSVNTILNSPAWKEFSFSEAYTRFTEDTDGDEDTSWKDSWENFGEYMKDKADVGGEKAARRTLGVSRRADWKEIKSAHRRLAKKLHPDKGGDEVAFREMQAAYDVLKKVEDTKKRRRERRAARGGTGEL